MITHKLVLRHQLRSAIFTLVLNIDWYHWHCYTEKIYSIFMTGLLAVSIMKKKKNLQTCFSEWSGEDLIIKITIKQNTTEIIIVWGGVGGLEDLGILACQIWVGDLLEFGPILSGLVSSLRQALACKLRGPGFKFWPGKVGGLVTIIMWGARPGWELAWS